jgi:hypothetical protein
LETYGLFIDLVKAFDSISREALFSILRRYGLPDHFLIIIIRLHSNAKMKIAIPGGQEDGDDADVTVSSTIGVRQGSNEGPVLFLFFMLAVFHTLVWPEGIEPLEFMTTHERGEGKSNGRLLEDKCFFTLMQSLFADDCALFFKTRAALVAGTVCFHAHLKKLGLNMHVGRQDDGVESKTVAIFFPKRTGGDDDGDLARIELTDEIGPCFVGFADSIKYLGCIIHKSLSFECEVNARITAAQQVFGATFSTSCLGKFLKLKVTGRVFLSLVVSILLYGSECWIMTDVLHKRLTSFYNSCVRKMCRRTHWHSTRCQKIRSVDLQKRIGLKSFDEYYLKQLLQWAGKLSRMSMSRLPRKFLYAEVACSRPPGGNYSTWDGTLKRALTAVGETPETWMETAADPAVWAKVITTITHPFYSSSQPIAPAPSPPAAPAPPPLPLMGLPQHQHNLNPMAMPFHLVYQLQQGVQYAHLYDLGNITT